jgi:hypothetical protein
MDISEKRYLALTDDRAPDYFRWLSICTGVLLLCLYILTLAPQVYWRDSPEFVATSQTLSISHPAGSPAYNLFAKTFTFLPLANVVFRVHLASAVCGSLVFMLMIFVMRELFLLLFGKAPNRLQEWGMALCALVFGLSLYFWKFSVTAEVYTLQDALFLVVLWCGFRFYRQGDARFLLAGAFVFGLSLGAHMANALFLPPFFLFFILRKGGLKHLSMAAFFFLLGFCVYLYLPFRFEGAPLRLGYDVNNALHTFDHMTGKSVQDAVRDEFFRTAISSELRGVKILTFFERLIGEVSHLGLALGALGLVMLLRKRPVLGIILLLMFASYGGFFHDWRPMGLFPAYILWTIWMGVGFAGLLEGALHLSAQLARTRTRVLAKLLPFLLYLILLFQIGSQFRVNFAENNLRGFYIGRDLGANILDSLLYRSTLITRYSIPHFILFYLQEVEGYRRDVNAVASAAFTDRDALKRYVSTKLKRAQPNYLVGSDTTEMFYRHLLPHGLVFRFTQNPVPRGADLQDHMKYRTAFERGLSNDPYQNEYETYLELYRINSELHRYYSIREELDIEERELGALIKINPDSPFLNVFLAIDSHEMGKNEEARVALLRAETLLEKLQGKSYQLQRRLLYYNAGILALNSQDYALSEHFLKKALAMKPVDELTRYFLALVLYRQGKLEEARRHCLVACDLKPNEDNMELLQLIKEALPAKKED